jgi:D-glycero-D-manno-heptose 1,7-bisphosphate phosphatase
MNIVLLDRDGTVIVDPPDERVDKEEKIELFPDTLESLKYLAINNFAVIFVTNQAGISEGRINEEDFERIHSKVLEKFASTGVTILKTYMCPHEPDDGCDCRKPKPTMLLQAAKEFDIYLPNAFMVGDRQGDVMAGVNAGTKTILVETANTPVTSIEATYTAPNLLDAVKYIVNN